MCRRRGASLGALALLLVFQGLVIASAATDPPILAWPRVGDTGAYEAWFESGEVAMPTSAWREAWALVEPTLAGQPVPALPTLVRVFDRDAGPRASALGRGDLFASGPPPASAALHAATHVARHFTALPGAPAVQTYEAARVDWESGHLRAPPSYVATTLRVEGMVEGCGGEPAGLIAGLPAARAAARLEQCLREAAPGAVVEARWGWSSEAPERRWRFDAVRRLGASEERFWLVTSPARSVVDEAGREGTGPGEAGPAPYRAAMRLVGWLPGAQALPAAGGPLPPMPEVPLVPWSPRGPERGDVAWFPLREAAERVAATETGAAWFAEHPGAGIARAAFSVGEVGPLATRCTEARDAAAALPRARDWSLWSVLWSDGTQDLHGSSSAPVLARRNALDLAAPVDQTSAHLEPGTPAPAAPPLAPEPAALLEHAAAQGGPDARPFFEVGAAGAPGAEGRPGASVATAGRTDCGAVLVGTTFVDGRARASFASSVQRPSWMAVPIPGVTGGPRALGAALVLPRPEPLVLSGVVALAAGLSLHALRFVVGLFSRLGPREALDHPTRARILAAVRARPGITLPEVSRDLGVHRASVAHHLRTLARLRFVVLTRTVRGLAVHPVGDPAALRARVMARAHAPRMAELVAQHPGATVGELAALAGLRKGKASELLRDLEDARVVTRAREGRRVRVLPGAMRVPGK